MLNSPLSASKIAARESRDALNFKCGHLWVGGGGVCYQHETLKLTRSTRVDDVRLADARLTLTLGTTLRMQSALFSLSRSGSAVMTLIC